MKVVMGDKPVPGFVEELRREFPQVEFREAATPADKLREVRDADVYYGWIPRDVFLAAKRLQWIQIPGTGVDHVLSTVPELVDSDVVLVNSRGPHAAPIADHVMGMVVALSHQFRRLSEDQKAHRWDGAAYFERFLEISGSTMGIVALGDIGSAVARRAAGFGMRVLAMDKRPVRPPQGVEAVWPAEKLDDLLRQSDWVVVTTPYTKETKGLIDRRRIGLMKRGAFLIAVSRGDIVDEAALVDALKSGHLRGAGLDVTAVEPLPDSSPLWDMENVIISPHVSAYTPGTFSGRREIFKENLRRAMANRPFLYAADKKAGF